MQHIKRIEAASLFSLERCFQCAAHQLKATILDWCLRHHCHWPVKLARSWRLERWPRTASACSGLPLADHIASRSSLSPGASRRQRGVSLPREARKTYTLRHCHQRVSATTNGHSDMLHYVVLPVAELVRFSRRPVRVGCSRAFVSSIPAACSSPFALSSCPHRRTTQLLMKSCCV